MRLSHFSRIKFELFGDLVEMNFERIARLGRAMPALRSAWRFVSKNAQAIKLVAWHFISDSLQSSGVERARHAVAAIGAAVEKRFEMHRGDRAVLFHSGLDVHEDRMTATMTIKNFFARQRALHRTPRHHREFANNHFMIELVALAAKATAIRRRDDANVAGRHCKNLGQRA